MKLTQDAVDSFIAPKGKADHIEWFDGMPGFGLRVRDGRRTYVYQYKIGEQHRRIAIGDAAKLKFKQAKAAMEIHVGEIAKGKDPQGERKAKKDKDAAERVARLRAKAAKTLREHVTDYLDYARQTTKPRSYVEIERLLTKDYYWTALHDLPLAAIDMQVVAAQLKAISKARSGSTANQARIALSSFFRWAIGEGLCLTNPVTGTNKPVVPASRDRVLTDAELVAILNAAPAGDYGNIVRLLALTGQRREEIGSLGWSEVYDLDTDRARIVLPGKTTPDGAPGLRTKNGWQHEIPLSADSAAVLKAIPRRGERDLIFGTGDGGFAGWSKAKAALDADLGKAVQPWRLHDLRRTAATRMADSGVLPHVIEAALNHISGHKSGVAGIYNRAAYSAEKREALDTLSSYIKTATAKATGANVTRLSRKP